MDLTSWTGEVPRKADVAVAKSARGEAEAKATESLLS
jgi:hypothetical protein